MEALSIDSIDLSPPLKTSSHPLSYHSGFSRVFLTSSLLLSPYSTLSVLRELLLSFNPVLIYPRAE